MKVSHNNTVLSAVTLKDQNFFLLKNKNTELQLVKRESTLNSSNLIEMQEALQAGINDASVNHNSLDDFLKALDENTHTINQLDIAYQIKALNKTEKILLPNKEITV